MSSRPDFATAPWHRRLYALLVVLPILGVWLMPRLPTQDGASHAYGLMVVRELLRGEGGWNATFELGGFLHPNLGFLLVGAPLVALLEPSTGAWVAERAAVTAVLLLLAAGVPAYLRAFGRKPLPLAFVVPALSLNYALFFGFYSYSLAAAALFPVAGHLWRHRGDRLPMRAARAAMFGAGLWCLHLTGAVLVALFAVAIELGRPSPRTATERNTAGSVVAGTGARLARAAAVIGPLALFVAAMAVSSAGGTLTSVSVRHSPVVLAWFLSHFTTVVLAPVQLLPAYLFLVWLLFTFPWRGEIDDHRWRSLVLSAAAIVVLTLALPNVLASGVYVNERLPWLAPLLVLPLLRPPRLGRGAPGSPGAPGDRAGSTGGGVAWSHALVLLSVVWLAVSAVAAWRLAASLPRLPRVPAGSTVAVARFGARPLWPLHDPALHTGSEVGRASKAVDLAFHEFYLAHYPIRWRDASWPPSEDLADLYYRPREASDAAWRLADIVIALDASPEDRAWLADRCSLVAAGEGAGGGTWPASAWSSCLQGPGR